MKILLDEEKANLVTLENKLKEQIETVKKFQTEAEYPQKEKQLQSVIERHQYQIKKRKHRQFKRDLADFKDYKVYCTVSGHQPRKDPESEVSSTETDFSDTERYQPSRGQRSRAKGRRGGYRNNNPRGQGKFFLENPHPYSLRDRNPNPGY